MHLDVQAPAELYTTATLFTQAGMTFTAWVIPALLVAAIPVLQPARVLLLLIIGVGMAVVAAFIGTNGNAFSDPLKLVVAVVNGFVVAAGALGLNAATDSRAKGTLLGPGGADTFRTRLWRSWL
jgi:O-antigen/teichoic acid export membrane protein